MLCTYIIRAFKFSIYWKIRYGGMTMTTEFWTSCTVNQEQHVLLTGNTWLCKWWHLPAFRNEHGTNITDNWLSTPISCRPTKSVGLVVSWVFKDLTSSQICGQVLTEFEFSHGCNSFNSHVYTFPIDYNVLLRGPPRASLKYMYASIVIHIIYIFIHNYI